MKKSVFSIALSLIAAPAFALGPGAEFKSYEKHKIDLNAQARYYQANGNFTRSGNSYDSLPSGYSFQDLQFDLQARSHLFANWAGFLRTTIGNVTASSPSTTHTNSALSEAQAGFDFLMSEGSFNLIPEFSATLPFSKNDFAADTSAVGDGATQISARMIVNTPLSQRLNLAAFAGFTYRDQGLSSILPYGTLIELKLKRYTLGADLRGFASIGYDKDSDNEVPRDAYFCRANGCAKRYGAVNPSLTESNLWLRWVLNPELDLNFAANFSITGQNMATGVQGLVGIEYHWRPAPEQSSSPIDSSDRRITNPNFEESVDDGVDQRLFEAPRPAAPPAPKIKRVAPQKRTPPPEQVIQNELNKTEMQIELKSSRKSKKKKSN